MGSGNGLGVMARRRQVQPYITLIGLFVSFQLASFN
jgi:hypothetical protein